jgi:ATP-dependent DNA helicase RecG
MITLDNLEKWLNAPAETEQLEFKEAKQQFDSIKLLKYCVALANEGGGYIVLGVTDKKPRQVVGSLAWSAAEALNSIN